jgi:TPR repeat protein
MMRHYAKVVRARLTTLLMLVVTAVAAVAGPASGKVMLADDKIMSDEEAERYLEKHIAEQAEREAQQAVRDALDAEKRGDYATAYKLLRSHKGFAHADDYLDKLKATMTPAQIAEAEKQAVIDEAIHALGNGRKEDYVRAVQLLRPLADQGDAQAEYVLGRSYYLSAPESAVEAVKWYKKAAEQGYAMAQYMLGNAYQEGVGVLRDVVAAHMWLNLAAAGNQSAAEVRDELEKRMTPAQIAEAEKLAREWKPTMQPQ